MIKLTGKNFKVTIVNIYRLEKIYKNGENKK